MKPLPRESVFESFRAAEKRALYLDYDGTIVPFNVSPALARPSNELLMILRTLASDQSNAVSIVSGRTKVFLDECFENIPVTLVAEHGAFIKEKGACWVETSLDASWLSWVHKYFDGWCAKVPHSFVEKKQCSVAWHYRGVDRTLGERCSRTVLEEIRSRINSDKLALDVLDGDCVIEVRMSGVNKGKSVQVLNRKARPDFVIAIGDDITDEDMFKALDDDAITIKVGKGMSNAKYFVSISEDVVALLYDFMRIA